MIERERIYDKSSLPHQSTVSMKIAVCVRKRPIFQREEAQGEIDAVSAANPVIRVHECKHKVDGITKIIENHDFVFDNTFGSGETSQDLYESALKPNLQLPFVRGGVLTCFAYGQTGSGKTFTMKGCNESAINDLFRQARKYQSTLHLSFFEIYSGKVFDLLPKDGGRALLQLLEDGKQQI